MSGSIWERFTLDPRLEENARLRAADRERDVVNDLLGTAYSEGRLTPEELDERTDRVAGARTLGELPAVIDDLVAPSGSTTPVADSTSSWRSSVTPVGGRRIRDARATTNFFPSA